MQWNVQSNGSTQGGNPPRELFLLWLFISKKHLALMLHLSVYFGVIKEECDVFTTSYHPCIYTSALFLRCHTHLYLPTDHQIWVKTVFVSEVVFYYGLVQVVHHK